MTKESVLIIEDKEDLRELLHKTLSRVGEYDVMVARDGREGLERALNDAPSVIVLDLALPYMDGLDIMEALKAQNRTIPTIIMTADSRPQTILRAFRLGAKEFLQKPFEIEEIWTALERALTEERLRREKEQLTKALARANLHQQRQLENWEAINFIAKTITSTLEEEEVLRRVVATVNHVLKVEAGSLLLLDEKTQELHFAITLKGNVSRFSNVRLKLGQGIAGWVAQHGRPLLVPDVHRDARFYAQIDQLGGFQTRAILCVPLKSKDRILGAFEVINKLEGPTSPAFTPEDAKLLQTLASWTTIAVENARLNRTLQENAAAATLKQAVVTLAHYINNQLMNHMLELDSLERSNMPSQRKIHAMLESSRTCAQNISKVVAALDRLSTIETVPYVGSEQMIDINRFLFEKE
ncbi:MAG: response regulator [Anaerolineae bacterium]|nr:response regulator [Anaerolineae bacterium]